MNKCRCKTSHHPHGPTGCNKDATTNDSMCKDCHDRASEEWAGTLGSNVFDVSRVTEAVQVTLSETKEYYQKNKRILLVVIIIAIGSPFIGLFIFGIYGVLVGLLLSGVSYFISPLAITKVKEIHDVR